jgi:hypothetical protein
MTKFEPEAELRRIHSGEVAALITVPARCHGMFRLEAKPLAALRDDRRWGVLADTVPKFGFRPQGAMSLI